MKAQAAKHPRSSVLHKSITKLSCWCYSSWGIVQNGFFEKKKGEKKSLLKKREEGDHSEKKKTSFSDALYLESTFRFAEKGGGKKK